MRRCSRTCRSRRVRDVRRTSQWSRPQHAFARSGLLTAVSCALTIGRGGSHRSLSGFIAVVVLFLVVAVLVVSVSGEAQQTGSLGRIGFLTPASLSDARIPRFVQDFRQGLREMGYVEGENVVIE